MLYIPARLDNTFTPLRLSSSVASSPHRETSIGSQTNCGVVRDRVLATAILVNWSANVAGQLCGTKVYTSGTFMRHYTQEQLRHEIK
jgi:hypothetical protein